MIRPEKQRPRVSWPPYVKDWLENPRNDILLTEADRVRRALIVSDSRMHEVAHYFLPNLEMDPLDADDLLPGNDPRVIQFLSAALHLPRFWDFLNSLEYRENKERREELARAAGSMTRHLKRNEQLVSWYLATPGGPDEGYSAGAERLVELLATIDLVASGARRARDEGSRHTWPEFPRKRSAPQARERFFVRNLAHVTKSIFGKPMNRILGLTATVLLELPRELSVDEVKDLARKRP